MTISAFPAPADVQAVLFDFHSTLVDQGDGASWVRLAWQHAGRDGDPVTALGQDRAGALAHWVERVWEHAREVDPTSRRDHDPASHREVFATLVEAVPEIDDDLAHSLYEVMLETWIPYDDAVPVLTELRRRGVRTALVSNIGLDVRELLARIGLTDLLDAVVLSFEVGAVKPDVAIFQTALDLLDVPADRALMVGDSWKDDAGAAALGIRTLILPRTSGPAHGLDQVLRLVGNRAT